MSNETLKGIKINFEKTNIKHDDSIHKEDRLP